MSTDTRKAFESWDQQQYALAPAHYSSINGLYVDHLVQNRWAAWTASRCQALEEAALIAEKTYAKDAFRFVLGTEAAAAIRKLGAQE
jgi:hypothetical protein